MKYLVCLIKPPIYKTGSLSCQAQLTLVKYLLYIQYSQFSPVDVWIWSCCDYSLFYQNWQWQLHITTGNALYATTKCGLFTSHYSVFIRCKQIVNKWYVNLYNWTILFSGKIELGAEKWQRITGWLNQKTTGPKWGKWVNNFVNYRIWQNK